MTEATAATRSGTSIARLADTIHALAGWRRLALAAVLGAATTLALPPVHIVPLLIPAFVSLLWQLEGIESRRGAFALGWVFGVGHFAAGLYWVGIAFFVDAPTFGWMMPFAVTGLAAGLAIFTGLVTLAVWSLPWRGPSMVLVFTAAWGVAAWLRGHILTGFPWNLLGTAWTFSDTAIQAAALLGAWGLSLITVFAAAAPATLAMPGGRWRRWGLPTAAAALVVALFAGGALRLALAQPAGSESVPDVRLRIVQAAVPQDLKWDRDLRLQHLQRHLDMTQAPGFERATHVVWPETAVAFFLSQEPELRNDLAPAAPPGGALITGLPRAQAPVDDEGGQALPTFYNSLAAIGPDGADLAVYDKFHLVPFGEYVPLREWLPVDKLTPGAIDFSPGPGPRSLRVDGLPAFSPLICYEAIFPGNVLDREDRPDWLLNVTNDAWFGHSSGPYQHLASARLRAVEEGLPLVRAANTGISVVADAHGRILHRLALGERGVIDAGLPRSLNGLTPYARFGDIGFAVLLVMVFAAAAALRRR